MVKKLRYKFVIITMLLMASVFGILASVDFLYSLYWNNMETLQLLQWFAASDCLKEGKDNIEVSQQDFGSPIYFVLLDSDGQVISTVNTSNNNHISAPDKLITAVREGSPEGWKWKSYIYTVREYEDNQMGIYYVNMLDDTQTFPRLLGEIFLIAVGFALLLKVSFYLSKYVVEPAKNALEREKQFITDASHELKTPVTAISINAQALRNELNDNKHLNYIISESARMDRLIHKLLTLSYLEEQGAKVTKELFSLSECCEEIVLTLESMAFEKKIQFEYDIEEEIDYMGNVDEIKQVITILLDNAIKHTPEKGKIKLNLCSKKGKPLLTVFNTGKGISPEDLPHIFERFYCTEKSRNEASENFGLGLAIAKTIVDTHKGKISATSELGCNVCFYVEL